eukprot:Em0006g342a
MARYGTAQHGKATAYRAMMNTTRGGNWVDPEVELNSVSLVKHDIAKRFNGTSAGDVPKLRLVSAGGEELPIVNNVKAAVKLSGIEEIPEHSFIVVEQLISQFILEVDFLQQQDLIEKADNCEHSTSTTTRTRTTAGNTESRARKESKDTVRQARDQFVKTPGLTKLACHQINTVGSPARVPPRRIPAHFQQEIQEQMNDVLKKGIIVESSSSWQAPAVYTRKKTGEIRLCVDYRKVNKRTRDAYPLPLIDEVQDCLSGATVFSILDLQCGYWQVPVDPKDQRRQHSHLVLEQGCSSSVLACVELPAHSRDSWDVVMRGLPFVTTYIDDALRTAQEHLDQAFKCLREAGLTFRGS